MDDEKREQKRAYFSLNDNLTGTFSFSEGDKQHISKAILNLSTGGCGFLITRDEGETLNEGDSLSILNVKIREHNLFEAEITARIKYLLKYQSCDYILMGCEFIVIPEEIREKIRQFVEKRIFEAKTT